MMKLQQTEAPIAELQLTTSQRQYLEAALSTYADLKVDFENISHLMDIEKLTIGGILEEAGVNKTCTEYFSLCWVRGATNSKLDPQKLIASGVSLAQIEAATVTRLRKPYFSIRSKSTGGSSSGPTDE